MASQFTFVRQWTSPRMRMEVVLGSHTIKAFVTAPKEFNVLGIVRLGMEFGLLAKTDEGNYVRINGSNIQTLNNQEVDAAIDRATTFGRGEPFAPRRPAEVPQTAPVPIVTARKCRKIDPLLTNASTWSRPYAARRTAA